MLFFFAAAAVVVVVVVHIGPAVAVVLVRFAMPADSSSERSFLSVLETVVYLLESARLATRETFLLETEKEIFVAEKLCDT